MARRKVGMREKEKKHELTDLQMKIVKNGKIAELTVFGQRSVCGARPAVHGVWLHAMYGSISVGHTASVCSETKSILKRNVPSRTGRIS